MHLLFFLKGGVFLFVWFCPANGLFYGGFNGDEPIFCRFEECVHYNVCTDELAMTLVSYGFVMFTCSIMR